MDERSADSAADSTAGQLTVSAGLLPPWHVAQLPEPPRPGWRLWIGLLGPGVVLAGTSIGSGEWLFGPAVSAQYGATLLWIASLSIILQVFCNLMMMRYTLYCGEPILVGGMRTFPGPRPWMGVYGLMDLTSIWPYNASNAAVPLAAAIIGHLPGDASVSLLGHAVDERTFVRILGIAVFLLAFVPLVFGGTIYRMLEKVMSIKLVLILGYLGFVSVFMVSPRVAWEVVSGFFAVGTYPERADTILVDPHFTYTYLDGGDLLVVKGTIQADREHPMLAEYRIGGVKQDLERPVRRRAAPPRYGRRRRRTADAARHVPARDSARQAGSDPHGRGQDRRGPLGRRTLHGPQCRGAARFDRLDEMPPIYARRLAELVANQGVEKHSLFAYIFEHHELPNINWMMLAAFAGIAGAGGMTNSMFSNYTREKGWGMGAHVGAIPSAIGGRTIPLSHTGKVFLIDSESLRRWRGWLRHVFRDQVAVWMLASFVGMALPCMLSLEFIRNTTVFEHRVAAMTAEGLINRYPQHAQLLWTLTLLCGFLILAPGQISAADQISRRWTDIVWTSSAKARRLGDTSVKYVYYSILSGYAVWGLVILCLLPTLQIAVIGAALQNLALGISAVQAWHTNRTLMPRALQPHWLLQAGTICCGLFFALVGVVGAYALLRH